MPGIEEAIGSGVLEERCNYVNPKYNNNQCFQQIFFEI